ncbi:MAG: HTH domain-containing protein [Paludibacteraceae bacterium]|nr:HTH domain-containing protein [Paludibacteraceae bacterium]
MDPELRKKISQCERQQQQLWAFRPLSEDTLKSLREYYRFIADRVIMTQLDILRLFQASEPAPVSVEDFEQRLFQTIADTPGLNAPQLAARLGRSLRTTQRYIKQLSDAHKIAFRGVAKKGGYHVV